MMSKRYLDIKENSLEASVFEVLNNLQEKKVVETNKNDKSDDGDGLDAVQPKAVKKKFKDRKDKDVDNDGDVDSSDKFIHKKRKAISKAMAKEDTDLSLDEGRMSQLHQMIKDKKTAAQIAKEMKLDVKTIKALMASYEQMVPESFEIGTEKYLKHTVETTPGQKAWTEVVTKKATSMRETLAKMWKVDEGKNVFAKEAKKDLTNAVKGGKTMTGKKISVVDTSPTIKEKKK